jgi:hypothetical protein
LEIQEIFRVKGHRKIKATHLTTFEFTRDPHLTWRGDCIIGVKASKALIQLSDEFKFIVKNPHTHISIQIEVEGIIEEIEGKGHSSLTLTDHKDLVVRKSLFVCNRTLMILSNKAAIDLSRDIIEIMKNPQSKMEVLLTAKL